MANQTPSRIEFVIAKLRALGRKNWRALAETTGVPYSTIYKVAYRDTKNPGCLTLDPLHDHLKAIDGTPKVTAIADRRKTSPAQQIRETSGSMRLPPKAPK